MITVDLEALSVSTVDEIFVAMNQLAREIEHSNYDIQSMQEAIQRKEEDVKAMRAQKRKLMALLRETTPQNTG